MQRTVSSTDYARMIDEETRDFIRQTERTYPADATSISIEEQRRLYDDMARQFSCNPAQGVLKTDGAFLHSFGANKSYTCHIRQYQNNPPQGRTGQLLYFHGGGFIMGGLESHDDICAEICQRTQLTVTSVDYRLIPEHPHPAAFNDCIAAIQNNHDTYGQSLVLCGDSAGANLCAAAVHALRDSEISIAGQILIYPGLGADWNQGSYIEHAQAPLLTTQDVAYYASLRCAFGANQNDPQLAPLCDKDFSNLPPTFIVTADCDPLRDDGMLYQQAIIAAGGQAVWVNETGLVHGFLRARHTVTRARESFDRIIQAINQLVSDGSFA